MFIIDVDGCLTDGSFYYSGSGKVLKRFGPDDADALAPYRNIVRLITADKRGWNITAARANDMGIELLHVPAVDRLERLNAQFNNMHAHIFMGDGFLDVPTLEAAGYGITPLNAHPAATCAADYTVSRAGGDRAVALAVEHLHREGML